jgi:hypothetical protein
VPKYRGGSDDETNLISVSITEHVMWHFCNYQLWGNIEDKLAYKGLSGKTKEREELLAQMSRERRWITNGTDSKLCKVDKLPDGWYYGRVVPDGFGEAISKSTKGKKQTSEHVSKRFENRESKVPMFWVIPPQGEPYLYAGLSHFCRKVGWPVESGSTRIRECFRGYRTSGHNRHHYKGYKFIRFM